MLVLSRKRGQSIIIHDDIEITVLETEGDVVKIGITAPKEVTIVRKELYVSVKESNQEAASQLLNVQQLSAELKKFKRNL